MPTYIIIIAVATAALIAYFSVPLTIRIALRIGAIDEPDQRKVHQVAMPRVGGIAIFLAFLLSMLIFIPKSAQINGLIIGAVIIFTAGLLDDIFTLPAWVKLIPQVLAASVAVYSGIVVSFVTNPFDGMLNLGYLSIPITLLWIVGITNAINLIDGLDGLAAGVTAIAGCTMGIVTLLNGQTVAAVMAFILVASTIGFLPYNFHPARTFMGDCGSNLLGFVLGCLAVLGLAKSAAIISLFVPIFILVIPIFDTFFAIVRRIYNKTPIFSPDKDHLHHRLMGMGFSHQNSVLIIYGISSFFAIIAIVMSSISNPKATLVLSLLLLLIVLGAFKIGLMTGGKPRVQIRHEHSEHFENF
ncbi:MAG: MraY family glycosyltransferase [Syntrophomonadaceae bacterium]|nr:MraY family glycosyltransferase [Syntrophomonadaceae bacterium]MDD4562767.1 MraY family glycosyltransferase [Syntrophomonadaceae bacterium]